MPFPLTRMEGELTKGFGKKDFGRTKFDVFIRLLMIR